MSKLQTPFKLHAPNLSPDTPVDAQGELPPEVAGKPASYFWKDLIHSGNYVHPTRGFSLKVDRDRLARWADTGQQLLAAGVALPINCDHSDAARDVVGYIQQFKLDGDRLLALCQFIGEDAALTAARNFVSVGVDPDFTDGEARHWGEAIVHMALTPVPVVPGQDQFIEAAAPPEPPPPPTSALPCTAEQFQTLCDLIGEEIAPETGVDQIISHLRSPAGSDSAELAAAREQILRLSSRVPEALPPEAQAAIAESATARFDAAVDRGLLSPWARDQLVATLVQDAGGNANVLTLSRAANPGSSRCLAMAVADAVLNNEPVSLGERTGLQAMSRPIPGDESSSIDQLRTYMTKVASVSG